MDSLDGSISISMSNDHALVILEFIAEMHDGSRQVDGILPSEKIALSYLESALEELLVQPFDKDYASILDEARRRVEEVRGR